jgi:hypothetical protein
MTRPTLRLLTSLTSLTSLLLAASTSWAADDPPARPAPGHGPSAPASAFPSHDFQLAAHVPETAQVSFHAGLIQPILLQGFNAAVDVRVDRFIVTYSHGEGLDLTDLQTDAEKKSGLQTREPWTTGGGVGVVLIDELYVLADLKVHRFELESASPRGGVDEAAYTTVTVGGEVGWRFFVWKGLHVAPVVRFWPNVWDSAPDGGVALRTRDGSISRHDPMKQGAGGLFANVLVGWAFDL